MRLWRSIRDHLFPTPYNAHRPRLLRKGWLLALLGVALVSEAALVGPALLRQGPDVFLAAVVRSDVIEYTDRAREDEGGAPLAENDTLDAAAQAKADDMAARGYFSHVGPDGEAPWVWLERAGYNYLYAGENLAVRFEDSQDVVDAWMASPTHRANIVKPQYQEIGVGVADGAYKGAPATFVVQYFGSPVGGISAPPVQSSQAAAAAQAPQPQSWLRSAGKALADSRNASWALGLTTGLLAVVIALTFFIRIQVQPTDLLAPGFAVLLIALTFMAANARFLPGAQQSASVGAAGQGEVGEAAAVGQLNAFPEAPAR
jgi:hypothetical protein